MNFGLQDLDELYLSCRTKESRTYIREAIDSYKAGAFRSAIIATWIAVVFDFVSKLRELEMTGDKQAKKKLEEFDTARKAHEPGPALAFERNAVTAMRDEFELLSPVEAVDFDRLFQDRNRCAHPSMVSSDEPFQPTAELARTHLAASVMCLLQHPPVQGKAALERIWADIKSEYFPKDEASAKEFLKNGPLQRARPALVRSVTIGLTKDILFEGKKNAERLRQYAALKAIMAMYNDFAMSALKENLPTILANAPDARFNQAIRYFYNLPDAWNCAGEPGQIRAKEYVENGPVGKLALFLPYAIGFPPLRDIALPRSKDLDEEMLAKVIAIRPDPALVDEAIRMFSSSGGFRTAEKRLEELVLPVAEFLKSEHLRIIAEAFETNGQITLAAGVSDLLVSLLKTTDHLTESSKSHLRRIYKVLETNEYFTDQWGRGKTLKTLLRQKFGFRK